MAEWFNNPVFALGFVGALVTIGIWVGRVNSNRAQFKAFMREIGDELKEIRASIQGIFIRLGGPVTGDSPLRLTDMGDAISESLAIKEFVSRIADEIKDQAEGKQDFEIQEISLRLYQQTVPA